MPFGPIIMDTDLRFWTFHHNNPHVYAKLAELAKDAVNAGHQRIGIRMLWEVMRWHLTVMTKSGDDFRLNDHYTSRYARLLMAQEPELKGLFELRTLKSLVA